MKNQLMGLKILAALILIILFQTETSQARTVQECLGCTSNSCLDADDKEWCATNCDLDKIPDCLKVTPKMKNAADANRYGNAQRLELLHKIYKEFPLSKYFLNINAPEESERGKGDTLNEEEQKQLKAALAKLEAGCNDIVNKLEYSKGKNISAKTLFRSLNQVKDTLNKTKISFASINASFSNNPPPTRWDTKVAFDKANLDLKTCFNQGEGAFFEASQKESFTTKVADKISCSGCVATTCKSSKVFEKCVKSCPAYQIESCIKAGTAAGFDVASEKQP